MSRQEVLKLETAGLKKEYLDAVDYVVNMSGKYVELTYVFAYGKLAEAYYKFDDDDFRFFELAYKMNEVIPKI